MTALRIVCSFDAAGTAETLSRLLAAEQYDVRVSTGRQSLAELQHAREAQDIVVLIWSKAAPSTHYMREWAALIDPARLIEISRAAGWPRSVRRAPVIDFAAWRGERGGKAWGALNDRLRLASGRRQPSRLPVRTAAAGMVGLAAAAGMVVVGVNQLPEAPKAEPNLNQIAMLFETPLDETGGMGGVSYLVEPASLEAAPVLPNPRIRLRAAAIEPLETYTPEMTLNYEPAVLRDPTIVERLAALNPLARSDD
jgi:hypothetical protein